MGVNSNFDNSSIQPFLPPPTPPSNEGPEKDKQKAAPTQRDAAGNIRDGKDKATSDAAQTYANDTGETHTESEVHQQEQNQEGGEGRQGSEQGGGSGGNRDGSSGDSSDRRSDEGTFTFQEALEQLVGKGKISEGRNVAHVSVEGQAQVMSRDEIVQVDRGLQFKDKYNLGEAFNAKDLSTLKPDLPSLPPAKDANIDAVAKEMSGNPWLNNSFITTVTVNLLTMVRNKMQQQLEQGKAIINQLKIFGDLGTSLGNLALDKAKKEAEMHNVEAGVAIASFCVTAASAAFSVAGTLSSTVAGGVKSSAATKDPATSTAAASGAPTGGPKTAGGLDASYSKSQPPSTSPTTESSSTTSTTSSSSSASDGRGAGNVTIGSKPSLGSSRTQSQRATSSSSQAEGSTVQPQKPWASASKTPAGAEAAKPTQPWAKGSTPKSETTSTGETIHDGSVTNTQSAEAKSTTSAEGRTGWNKFGNSVKSKFGFKAKEGDGGGIGGPEAQAEAKAVKRAEYVEKGGDVAATIGQTLLQSSTQLGNAGDNLVQAAYKVQIGEIERETQIRQTQKQITQTILESTINDFKEAGQVIDSATQALQKVQDENARAHSAGRG